MQAASARARENISERIGFSSNKNSKRYKVASETGKLTIEEMNEYDMHDHVAAETDERFHGPEWRAPVERARM